MTERGCWSGS